MVCFNGFGVSTSLIFSSYYQLHYCLFEFTNTTNDYKNRLFWLNYFSVDFFFLCPKLLVLVVINFRLETVVLSRVTISRFQNKFRCNEIPRCTISSLYSHNTHKHLIALQVIIPRSLHNELILESILPKLYLYKQQSSTSVQFIEVLYDYTM